MDSKTRKSLRPGVYAPILTFFDTHTEELDLEALHHHVLRLVGAGLVGLVALGSNGEAVHLDRQERIQVVRATRTALDEAGHDNIPIIVGCTDQSTRHTITLCCEAAAAGADYVIVLPPCYYKPAMTDDTILQYFTDVADHSPVPVLMYNYPGAAAGLDMTSDLMIRIAAHPNVRGAKFTCANTGKIARVAAATTATTPFAPGSGFFAAGGLADMMCPAIAAGGSAVIAGAANVFPKLCVAVWEQAVQQQQQRGAGAASPARLQQLLAQADWAITKRGISGTKQALQESCGYGGLARRPLPRLSAQEVKSLMAELARAVEYEKQA